MCNRFIVIGECRYCDDVLIEDASTFDVADVPDSLVCDHCKPIEARRLAALASPASWLDGGADAVAMAKEDDARAASADPAAAPRDSSACDE